jgi:hypothetical protein
LFDAHDVILQVVWLEGLREFRRSSGPRSLPADRFRPKPAAHRPEAAGLPKGPLKKRPPA